MADPVDYGLRAHQRALEHLEECMRALDEQLEGGEPEWPADMGGDFCGCDDCQVREIPTAAWPDLVRAVRVELGMPADPEA